MLEMLSAAEGLGPAFAAASVQISSTSNQYIGVYGVLKYFTI